MCLFVKTLDDLLFLFIIHLISHVHEGPKGQVIITNPFICIYFWRWWKLCICTTDHDRSHREKCEMDLVMAQQLVQTWVMALVYWKLSRRGGSHGPTDVSSTNASLVSVPLLLFTRHLALLKIVFVWPTDLDPWWAAVIHWSFHNENIAYIKIHSWWYFKCRHVSGGTCQPLFTWQV